MIEQLPKGAGAGRIIGAVTAFPATQGAALGLSEVSREVRDGFIALRPGKHGACGDGEQTADWVAPSAHRSRVGHGVETFEDGA